MWAAIQARRPLPVRVPLLVRVLLQDSAFGFGHSLKPPPLESGAFTPGPTALHAQEAIRSEHMFLTPELCGLRVSEYAWDAFCATERPSTSEM